MSQGSDGLYRKEAMDRLSSPEQLDEVIALTSSGAWAGLIGLVLLLATILTWAVIGTIPTRVDGQGVLFYHGGQVVDAVGLATGTMTPTGLNVGDPVNKGDIVAIVDQPEVALRLAAAQKRVTELTRALDELEGEQARLNAMRRDNAEARKQSFADQIVAAQRRVEAYSDRLVVQTQLAAAGTVTTNSVQAAREQLDQANQDLAVARNETLAIDADLIAAAAVSARDVQSQKQQLAEAQAARDQLALQVEQFGQITAPVDGQLIEWKAPFGTQIGAGQAVASFASGSGQLQFLAYVPPNDGKRLAPGMPVNIELNGFKKEQWGTLNGTVLSVSPFPTTPEGMRAVLQNDALVTRFSQNGAPFAVEVALQTDPTSASGYVWSGGMGAVAPLSAGTIGQAKITVESRRPISFVLPYLLGAGGV